MDDRWQEYENRTHAPAPCDECGEVAVVARGRDRACMMTPRCKGRHKAPRLNQRKKKA